MYNSALIVCDAYIHFTATIMALLQLYFAVHSRLACSLLKITVTFELHASCIGEVYW